VDASCGFVTRGTGKFASSARGIAIVARRMTIRWGRGATRQAAVPIRIMRLASP